MNIEDFLSAEDVLVDYPAINKSRLILRLAESAATRLNLNAAQVARAVLEREDLGSTGIGGGVALPHASVSGIDRPFGILVRLKRPIDFEAVDGGAVDVVFLLLAPPPRTGDQLSALACIARALKKPEVLANLRSADSSQAAFQAVTAGVSRPDERPP